MENKKLEIAGRLVRFGQLRFGTERGWKSRFAEALGLSPGGLQLYITGERTPGSEMHQRLRDLGCDIEWLMTGRERDGRSRGDPSQQELLAILKNAGIDSPDKLRELLVQNEQLRRALGPEVIAALSEAAIVMEKQAKSRARRKN